MILRVLFEMDEWFLMVWFAGFVVWFLVSRMAWDVFGRFACGLYSLGCPVKFPRFQKGTVGALARELLGI